VGESGDVRAGAGDPERDLRGPLERLGEQVVRPLAQLEPVERRAVGARVREGELLGPRPQRGGLPHCAARFGPVGSRARRLADQARGHGQDQRCGRAAAGYGVVVAQPGQQLFDAPAQKVICRRVVHRQFLTRRKREA
jgi:hypothetical protein